jgi:hypothetical protein
MRLGAKVTMGVLALLLSACDLKLRQAKTPPAPQPTAAQAQPPPAPAPSEPLSIPQTQVKLPRPQPIDPEALATPPASPTRAPSAARQSQHAGRHVGPTPAAAGPAKPETVETAEAPPATEPARPRIEPVLPGDQRRQLQEDIAAKLRDVDQKIGRIAALKLPDSEKSSAETLRKFAGLSHQALERGDLQQAGALADRALLLTQELLRDR